MSIIPFNNGANYGDMKAFTLLPKKLKMAALLVVLMAIIAFTAISMKYALQNIDQTLTSVYRDRLRPAVELVYLNENLYAKRLLLETYLSDHSILSIPTLQTQLRQATEDSYRRISKFEKTELTLKEAQQLRLFKANLSSHTDLERSILQLTKSGQQQAAVRLFKQQGYRLFQEDVQLLHQLVRIQSETGQQAVESGHRQAARGAITTTLLVGMAIIVALLIQPLLLKTTAVNEQPFGYFHLN